MSKDKKNEANPHGLGGTMQIDNPGGPQPKVESNGTPPEPAPAKAPAVKKSWSSPIQAMARIEACMNELEAKQQAIVFAWFAATYCPENSSMSVSTEPGR